MQNATEKSQKEQALEAVQALPNDVTFEDIQYHLYVLTKIEKGLEDLREGRTMTTDELKEQLSEWFDE